ncbi:MAG: ribosome biogenesis GTPase YlqF [Thermacetogeniaceae bacterium]
MTSDGGLNIHQQKVALLATYLKVVDLICELVDARCPLASSSPMVAKLIHNKQHVIVLNKAGLADQQITKAWLAYYQERGKVAVAVDSKNGQGLRELWKLITARTLAVNESLQSRGRRQRGLRVAVLGIPNTGKSTYLNRLIGQTSMRAGNKPGITRGSQWVHLSDAISVLDTPGIISIAKVSAVDKLKLAAVGSLDLQEYQPEAVSEWLLGFLQSQYPAVVERTFPLGPDQPCSFEEIALAKGFLMGSGIADTQRACIFLLEQFRSGKLGPISLEVPH